MVYLEPVRMNMERMFIENNTIALYAVPFIQRLIK